MEQSYPKSSSGYKMDSVQHKKIVLTSAEVLALFSTPLELVPAPGSGKAIKVVDAAGGVEAYNSAAYATNVTMNIITDTADQAQNSSAVLLTSTANRIVDIPKVAPTGATNKQIIENKSLKVAVGTGNPATGNSPIVLYIAYSIVDVNPTLD
jgi:hypothetical protein